MTKVLQLPWNQADHYWIALVPPPDMPFPAPLVQALRAQGFAPAPAYPAALSRRVDRAWAKPWREAAAALTSQPGAEHVRAAVIGGEAAPSAQQVEINAKSVAVISRIADSLWLGEALEQDGLLCYLQPVVSTPDKVFGYESFARVKGSDGEIISGDRIVEAARDLGIEYIIDRHLHVQAIKTFVASNLPGFLFVNFFTGFIHRPEVYLEGLTETARAFGLIAKYIVLDFTNAEAQQDMAHIRKVCEYCRGKGYSIALDDMATTDNAHRLIEEIRPDFIKLDRQLVHRVDKPSAQGTIRQLVEMAHKYGGTVIAEGVETEAMHEALRTTGVDLYQGFLFSPPVSFEEAVEQARLS